MSMLPLAEPVAHRLDLRDYQRDAIAAIRTAADEGCRRQLLVLPTGAGKTVTFGALAHEIGGETLILAHRDELIRQAVDKLRLIWPDAPCGVVKASENDVHAQVVVASVQTLARERRRRQLGERSRPFDLVIVDEAHHSCAKSYRDVLDYVGAGSDTTPWVWQDRADRPLLLGVTATPDRGDRVGLDAVFERIVFHRDMLWGIQSGFLADLRGLRVVLDIDLHKVKVRSGDYGDAELAEVLHNVGAPGIAVRAWHDHAEGRKTLVFTPTVALAHEMADSFLEAGVSAGVVHGEMDDRDRRDTLARFAAGDLQVLANCAVLTEGFDEPSVGCVILARPTRSRALYVQMLGRGTRRHPGKTDCLVIDMVDAAGDHDLVTMPDLFGLPLSALRKATVADAVDRVRADAEARQEAAAVLAEEINLWDRKFREAKLNWLQTAGAWVLATEGGFVALEETTPGWWRAVIKPRRGPFRLLVADVDLETAMSAGEDHVRRYAMRKALRARQSPAQATALVRADAPWRRRAPSEKMLGYAARVGVSVAGMRTAGEVADAIDAAKAAKDLARLPAELA